MITIRFLLGGLYTYSTYLVYFVCGVTRGEHAKYGCNTGNTLQNVVQYNYDIITSQCIKKKKNGKTKFFELIYNT